MYGDASVQDVADELGILKGSVYYYIKSKDELLFQLLNNVHEEVDAILEEVSKAEGLDPLERLKLYVREQTDYNLRNLVKISVYYHDIDQLSEPLRDRILRRRKVHEKFVTDLILEGQRQGMFDSTRDARLIGYCVFATIIWPYRWYRPGGRVKVEDVVDSCVAFVTHGVTPPSP